MVEKETRGQSSNKAWYTYRAGRITSSLMKSAARTSHSMLAQSLIKRICYPQLYSFSTAATRCPIVHVSICYHTRNFKTCFIILLF